MTAQKIRALRQEVTVTMPVSSNGYVIRPKDFEGINVCVVEARIEDRLSKLEA